MKHRDENEPSDPNAPLLPSEPLIDHEPQHDDGNIDSNQTNGWFIYALTFSAGISGLLFGYDTGVISSTLVSIKADLSNRNLSTLDKSLVTSCTSLFALVASPLAGILADNFGRRKVILVADVLFALGALIQAVTSTVWGMIAGRSIVGLAVGGASLVTPLYISELAPSHVRGRLVTILSLFITGGQVVAYIFFIVLALPETPRWLVQAGFGEKATSVLSKVYGGDPDGDLMAKRVMHDIQREVAQEEEQLSQTNNPSTGSRHWLDNITQCARSLVLVGGNRRALIIAVMLQGIQQLCGFNSLMYFSATIFSMLSFSSPTLTSLSVAMTNFLFTLLAFALIDRIGRRRILLYSIPVMALSLLACALTFASINMPKPESRVRAEDVTTSGSLLPVTILICLTVYTASYAFGLGNVPWQQSELFPLNVRSLGSALATATNWGSNFVVGLTFLPMMEWLSPGWTFAAYAAVCVIGWFGVWAIYPEMSGLRLEEVKELLADGWGVQESLTRRRSRHDIIQYIAYLLPHDVDIANLAQCCSSLAAKTLPAQASVWRRRFKDLYDVPQHYPSKEIKIRYQIRAIVLSKSISFCHGQKEKQTFWLEVMRDMILESNKQSPSKNFERIRCLLFNSSFLSRPVSGYGLKDAGRPSDLFCAIQLCLTELALDPVMSVHCLRTDYDIGAVYTYGVESGIPVVHSNKLNLEKILHIRNFWIRHLLNPAEATFCASYSSLPFYHRPRPWGEAAPLEASSPWLGYYSCIHPYPGLLKDLENRQTCADLDTHWTQVGFMSLQTKPDPSRLNWPPLFETIIPVNPLNSQRSYFRGIQKSSGSVDEAPCLVRGFCEPISIAQGGFPGWCRICFVIYERDPADIPPAPACDVTEPEADDYAWLFQEGWPPSDLVTEFYWIRGYEGVILPGGRIMIGSWIDMIDTADRGPFIFWKR
ncbi:MFS myo-inositol transporter [Aspergillus ibericus CBS 121593]|uniref:MFS myo-inositol transporter n=1 Tax=Aspergillus ibericus CBS 121593 TaxID=1448316 RepID=A0A395HDX3_9EURO|nr:MFS myo-inositol transporter [Aspergillus ibericus CBS 121593]RAL05699.1 MFS myo-inositol transporter [Aspergillus ibericus CBS 121593]